MRKTSDLRKAEIVATILGIADRIGPDRVTTGAVAIEVGVTQAAIFRHFPTEAAMWNAVANHVAEALTTAWDVALAQADLSVERVKALIGAQLGQIAATPALPMLLFSRELNVENADLRAAFRGRLATFHSHLAREVEEGQQAYALRSDGAAADAAVLLASLVQGVAIRWSLGARDIALHTEGLRLLDVQLDCLRQKGA